MYNQRPSTARPLCLPFLSLVVVLVALAVDTATAADTSHAVIPRLARCMRVSPAYAAFEPAVCLVSSCTMAVARPERGHSNSSEKKSEESQESHDCQEHWERQRPHEMHASRELESTQDGHKNQGGGQGQEAQGSHERQREPSPWTKTLCQLSLGRPTTSKRMYCLYSNPTFNAGRGITIIAAPDRMETMKTHPVFNASSGNSELDWPPHDRPHLATWHEKLVPGKGVGLGASRAIRRGERYMSRTPAVMVDGAAADALKGPDLAMMLGRATQTMPTAHRAKFLNLSASYGPRVAHKSDIDKYAFQVFATNAFRTDIADGHPDFHSVFVDVSRINHACNPNSAYFFDKNTLTHHIFAVVDIMPGEELTVGYIDPIQTRAERAANLHRHWGFECDCLRCSQLPHLVAESDSRVQSIRALLAHLDNYESHPALDSNFNPNEPHRGGPARAELLVELFELEGMHGRLQEAYYRLALEWNGVGDSIRAVAAARLCLDRGLRVRGPGQEFVKTMHTLIADPTAHWSWRFRIEKKDVPMFVR